MVEEADFIRFPTLPAEVKDMIWKEAMPYPEGDAKRVVRVQLFWGQHVKTDRVYLYLSNDSGKWSFTLCSEALLAVLIIKTLVLS